MLTCELVRAICSHSQKMAQTLAAAVSVSFLMSQTKDSASWAVDDSVGQGKASFLDRG